MIFIPDPDVLDDELRQLLNERDDGYVVAVFGLTDEVEVNLTAEGALDKFEVDQAFDTAEE